MTNRIEDRLVLYLYDELDLQERATVEALLAESAQARTLLAELRRLHAHLPGETAPVDPAALAILRQSTLARITAGENRSPYTRWGSSLVQVAAAALLLILGGIAGYLVRGGTQAGPTALDALLGTGRAVQGINPAVNPLLASVEKLSYNPHSGAIDIQFTALNEVQYSGSLSDPAMQSMLRSAISESDNPTVRLHAVKAMRSAAEGDPEAVLPEALVPLLIRLLDREPNLGIRLKIIELLGWHRSDPLVVAALSRMVMSGQPRPLRMAALQVMVSDGLSADERALIWGIARSDTTGIFGTALRAADSTVIDPIPGAMER